MTPPTIPWFGSPSGWVNVSTLRILDSLEKLKRPQHFVASSTLRNFLGSNEAMGPNWLRWMTHILRDNFGFQFSESPLFYLDEKPSFFFFWKSAEVVLPMQRSDLCRQRGRKNTRTSHTFPNIACSQLEIVTFWVQQMCVNFLRECTM